MDMLAFFVCEQIVYRIDGSLDIMRFGISDLPVATEKSPAQIILGLVCRLRFTAAEDGVHRIRFSLMAPDGELLVQSSQHEFITGAEGRHWEHAGAIPIQVRHPGDHAVIGVLDGREFARWPMKVESVPIDA